ncbi:MAG: hypothetical protein NTX26_00035 [Candidatus Parcubacteria bacterium]|nr:hypothetical protein [Candidatus Parcubacteria bacterium]
MPAIAYKISYNQNTYDNNGGGFNGLYFKGIKKTKRLLGGISLNALLFVIAIILCVGPYIALRCGAVSMDSEIKNLKQSLLGLVEANNTLETTVSKSLSPAQIVNWAKTNNFVEVNDFYPLVLNNTSSVALTK